jgi:hypothetical protein
MWESFSDQLAKLQIKLKAVDGLIKPPFKAPV